MQRPEPNTMIQSTSKIGDVIRQHPELLDELVAINPAFTALKNPLKRRVQGRLVTVGQAAKIAGLEEGALLRRLNTAIGLGSDEAPAVAAPSDTPAPAQPHWVNAALVVVEVDARPLQRAGDEPFSAIMAGIRRLGPGETLSLRSTFEPVPLYDVLGQRGFDYWPRQVASDDWEILIRRGAEGERVPQRARPPGPAPKAHRLAVPSRTITIDVSELVPPEPLVRVMEALESLPAGESLLVQHVRRPIHLYTRLDAEGYRHETHEIGPGQIEILIEKPADAR